MAKAWVYKRGRNTFVVFWRDASAKLRSKTFKHRHEADIFGHVGLTPYLAQRRLGRLLEKPRHGSIESTYKHAVHPC